MVGVVLLLFVAVGLVIAWRDGRLAKFGQAMSGDLVVNPS
jgi:hypothetical protein